MYNIAYQVEECNVIPTASTQNNAASVESAFDESVPDSGHEEGEEKELHAADKCNAKIHYFSRTIAKEHGIIRAAVLSGFAYKLKFHKLNKWKNRWWYYDPVETLRTHRWPYLSDGCISETTDYLAEKHLLIKDCNNKESYDRTIWYAMDDDVRARALSDLIWFDVRVVKKLRNILPGAIYHNLRFHLRKLLKQDPECIVPYHKLNQAMLARLLFVDVATIKRWVKTLKKEGFIIQHPKKRSLYTLADEHEYRPIDASANANGAFVNANGASANGASVNANDASVNAIGVKVNANDASVNDNTQYETNEKPVRNQSQKDGCVSACKSSLNVKEANHTIHSDHETISDAAGSVPLGGIEKAAAALSSEIPISYAKQVNTFEQLVHQVALSSSVLSSLDEAKRMSIQESLDGVCSHFVEKCMDAETIHGLWSTKNKNQLVQALKQPFAEYMAIDMDGYSDFQLSENQLWQLLYYPCLETLVRAFGKDEIWAGQTTHTVPEYRTEIWPTFRILWKKLKDDADFSPETKCSLLKEAIVRLNSYGWLLSDESKEKNAVQPVNLAFKKLRTIFENNPHLSVSQVIRVLRSCLEVIYFEEPLEGFDKYWAARQAKDLAKFAQHLERIVAELGMFEECPVVAASDKESV